MNNENLPAQEIAGKPSRLPAGSTFELSPGVHVAHPHAEVNLPGAGDTRLGDTDAVTESLKVEGEGDDRTLVVEQKPLSDDVKPKVMTIAAGAHEVKPDPGAAAGLGGATPAELT
jgi:hypothetical protein